MQPLPRYVLGFFFTWYNVEHRWLNAAGKPIVTTIPAIGRYNSRDSSVIAWQVSQAKHAGLNGFIASWAGRIDPQDSVIPTVLREANRQGFRLAVMLEHAPDTLAIAERLDDLMKRFASQPAYLRLPDGRAVVFAYIKLVTAAPIAWWRRYVAKHPDMFIAAFADAQTGDDGSTFPAYWYYSYVHDPWAYRDTSRVRATLPGHLKQMARRGLLGERALACTVEPGFDNRNLHDNFPVAVATPFAARTGGAYYTARWRALDQAPCVWVLIASWNEYFEGTNIEPDSIYGDFYVRLTRKLGDAWRAQR